MAQMTKEELRDARLEMGMTQKQLAHALDLTADNSKETVRGWEAGRRMIGGPEGVAIRLLLNEYRRNPPKPKPVPVPEPKRPRGRPRVHPIVDANAPKRPRGRPRKEAAE